MSERDPRPPALTATQKLIKAERMWCARLGLVAMALAALYGLYAIRLAHVNRVWPIGRSRHFLCVVAMAAAWPAAVVLAVVAVVVLAAEAGILDG